MRLAPEIGTSRGRRLVWVRVAQVGGGIVAAAAARVSGWAGNRRLGGWREAESERSEDLSLALVLAAFGVCLRPPLRRALQKFWANTEPAHPLARPECLLITGGHIACFSSFQLSANICLHFMGAACLLAYHPCARALFIKNTRLPPSRPPRSQS
jgi:hypothetical protein